MSDVVAGFLLGTSVWSVLLITVAVIAGRKNR